jgi:hypothetical protein
MAEKSFDELVKILRDRDIPFDRDGLKSAFKTPESQTAIRDWMREYLTPETLLTKEEATGYIVLIAVCIIPMLMSPRYATLTKSGDVERITAQDLSVVQGLNETEIQNAIEELKRSTAAIEKQTETLKLQQNAMSSLVKNEQRANQARASSTVAQHRKWTSESAQVCKAVSHFLLTN